MSNKNICVETVAVAFTDHLSVVMRLSVDVPIVRRGKGFWKMNNSILSEEAFKTLNAELNPISHWLELLEAHHILHVSRIRVKERLRQRWAVWRQQRRFYTKKKQFSLFCFQEGSERRSDFVKMENFLCECI